MPKSRQRDERLDVFRPIDPANRKATTAMICSIVGLLCCPLVGLIGIVLGLRVPPIATEDENERRLIRRRRGIAIIVGTLSIVTYSVLGVFLYPSLQQGALAIRADRDEATCKAKMEKLAEVIQRFYSNKFRPPTSLQELVDGEWLEPEDIYLVINDRPYQYRYVNLFDPAIKLDQIILFDDPTAHRDEGGHVLRVDFVVEYLPKEEFRAEINNIILPDDSLLDPDTMTATRPLQSD